MTNEILMALLVFAFVSCITPGPNNLMLMASGVNFGFARTIPHMSGVGFGFLFMLVLVGLGLVQVFDLFPVSYQAMKVLSVVYLVYLAWKIATAAGPSQQAGEAGKPFTFIQAALFQWVNPKAWAVAVTTITVYSPTRSLAAILSVCLVYAVVTMFAVVVWTLAGQQLRSLLNNKLKLRVFNGLMAVLLVASLYPVLRPA